MQSSEQDGKKSTRESRVTRKCHARFGERDRETRLMQIKKVRSVPTLPSGFCDPSPEDVSVTAEIVKSGKLLDVDVIDRAP